MTTGPTSDRRPDRNDVAAGSRLRTLRLAHGMSRRALGAAAGVSGQQVKKYEDGDNRIPLSRAYALSVALNTTVSDLTGGAHDVPADNPTQKSVDAAELSKLAMTMDDDLLGHLIAVARAAAK